MISLPRIVQGLILFSTLLGVIFLYQAYPLLPPFVFDILAFGWVLFLVDSILTFIWPRVSFYLGVVLAIIALSLTLSQPQHFALVTSGNYLAAATIILGSSAEFLLIVFGAYFVVSERRKDDPWAWPGKEETSGSPESE